MSKILIWEGEPPKTKISLGFSSDCTPEPEPEFLFFFATRPGNGNGGNGGKGEGGLGDVTKVSHLGIKKQSPGQALGNLV